MNKTLSDRLFVIFKKEIQLKEAVLQRTNKSEDARNSYNIFHDEHSQLLAAEEETREKLSNM